MGTQSLMDTLSHRIGNVTASGRGSVAACPHTLRGRVGLDSRPIRRNFARVSSKEEHFGNA